MNLPVKYVTNEDGERTEVILSIASYQTLVEDLEDLAAIADRRKEPTIPHSEFVANLKKDGLIRD